MNPTDDKRKYLKWTYLLGVGFWLVVISIGWQIIEGPGTVAPVIPATMKFYVTLVVLALLQFGMLVFWRCSLGKSPGVLKSILFALLAAVAVPVEVVGIMILCFFWVLMLPVACAALLIHLFMYIRLAR